MEFVLLFYAALGLDVCAGTILRRCPVAWSRTRDGVADLPV
jgi:hypothetical protein